MRSPTSLDKLSVFICLNSVSGFRGSLYHFIKSFLKNELEPYENIIKVRNILEQIMYLLNGGFLSSIMSLIFTEITSLYVPHQIYFFILPFSTRFAYTSCARREK